MVINVAYKDKNGFDRLALHPLQSWEWGEFRRRTGIEVIRLGRYEKSKLVETAQITIHQLPFTKYTIGYFPKGAIPSNKMIKKLLEIGKQYRCIFIKLEPNIKIPNDQQSITNNQLFHSPHPLFTKYTFQLDLTKPEEELLKNMHPKTRYNIKVAQKNGVIVKEDNSGEAFKKYLDLTFQTAKRQKFHAHNRHYHELMWDTLHYPQPDKLTAHLLTASYQSQILVTWIVFLFNDVLYYPYGASSDQHRHVMASNLIMWEAIKFGKKHGAKLFDMWGALGPNPDPKDPWYGFHRFKQGYGTTLTEFIGSFDLIINPYLYKLYNFVYAVREKILQTI